MKVLLDTNIIVDVALDRDPFFTNSEQVLARVERQEIQGYLSASTFSDLYYIIRKVKGHTWTLQFLQRMTTLCQVATVDNTTINMALTTTFKDFEDAIQYSTAVLNRLYAIITRNPGDFPVTTPRIITPEQLIQELINP
ncbi:PIN domain-containing protein [Brasilonema sp. UFV-L1]|uniref:PIN domain-containing protein n=1 Tax=Brasilonema sp. UFV-L1 TaxID=2234130 RepID=UPI00145FC730|nr:PIN domain-containing protein [Brasilonema sp. UFV-L1]